MYNGEPSGVEPVTENTQVVLPVAAAPLCSGVQDPHQACAFETNTTACEYIVANCNGE